MENRKQKEENEMEIDLVSLFFYLLDKWKLLFLEMCIRDSIISEVDKNEETK